MSKVIKLFLLSSIFFLCCINYSYACEYDYADATGYDNDGVSAQDATWNRLGTSWTSESSASDVSNNSDTDDGVRWSINGGTYGNDEITVGDTVIFEFVLSKVKWGRHDYDFLAAWIDWENDKVFDYDDKIYDAAFENKVHTEPDWYVSQYTNGGDPLIVETYYTEEITFDNIDAGDYWLRARVVCSADAVYLDNVSPTGHYYQGEIEDWKLTVNPVPEPATMLLLGTGLVGIAGFRRKFKK